MREYIANGFKVGPNYGRPPAPVANDWIDADQINEADQRVREPEHELSQWWTVFDDPVLSSLICLAYQQNLTLRQAGFRVLQARALRGIAVGEIFPQKQEWTGDYRRSVSSQELVNRGGAGGQRFTSLFDFGFSLAWELDFWGRFRRSIEAANANLDASVESYDDVLVTLLGDVALNYVQMRTFEQRIKNAQENVELQQVTLKIARAKVKGGLRPELDVVQAESILAQTEADIPELKIGLRLTTNRLCILLGIPPEDLRATLGPGPIPTTPPDISIGIPADLLRRRPDVRRAERQAAAQSALIGVAESRFYPHVSIVGTIGYSASRFKDLFQPTALTGTVGPTITWDILNYGRILNDVRFQNAAFQELVVAYQNTVLNANREVEDGLVIFLRGQERTKLQKQSVVLAEKAEKIVRAQYDAGAIDFTRVTQIQQNLVQQKDTLAQAQGEIALGLIQAFRALGGGWQIRETGCEPTIPFPNAILGPPVACLPPP